MKQVAKLTYGGFNTSVKLTDDVREYLSKKKHYFDLSQNLPSAKYLFERVLQNPEHKKFDLIYCGIFDDFKQYEAIDVIKERLQLKSIVWDGSTRYGDFFARWVIIKK